MSAPDVSVLNNLLKGMPIVLIAAGPSLDESLEFLKSIKDRSILICVNTAFRALFKAGIKPHFTIAADPRDSTYNGYLDCDTEGVYLIAPHLVNPKVASQFNNSVFTWSNHNILINYFRKNLNLAPQSEIGEYGTVSASIISLAELWRSKKVCFVGLDLAMTLDGKTHTKESFYADQGYFDFNESGCTKLPGNTLNEVLVDEKLDIYLKLFESLIENSNDLEFINTSPLGVK